MYFYQSFPGNTHPSSFNFFLVPCTRGKAGSAFAGVFEAGSQTLSAGGGSWFPGIAEQILCSLHVYPEEQVVRAFRASVLARLSPHSSLHCLLRQTLTRCVSSGDGVLAKDINNVQECCVLPEVLAWRGHTAQFKGISLT